MNNMEKALWELEGMDDLAAGDSPLHRLHPAAKLLAAVIYIVTVTSFDKYDLSGLMPMVLFPALLFQIGGIPVRACFRKLRVVLPLVMAVGLFDPLFDRAPGQKGIPFSAWGSFLGQLLLRSADRSRELYAAMLLRGYDGRFYYADPGPFRFADAGCLIGAAALFALFRIFPVARALGALAVR